MDEAALMHLRGELEKEDGKTGIGLGNIFRRIRAMYQDGNVEIYSKKDVGTVVKYRSDIRKWGSMMYRVLVADDEPIERMIVGRTIKNIFRTVRSCGSRKRQGGGKVFYRKRL